MFIAFILLKASRSKNLNNKAYDLKKDLLNFIDYAKKLNIKRPNPGHFEYENESVYTTEEKIEIFEIFKSAGFSIKLIEFFVHCSLSGKNFSRLKEKLLKKEQNNLNTLSNPVEINKANLFDSSDSPFEQKNEKNELKEIKEINPLEEKLINLKKTIEKLKKTSTN